MIKYLMTLGTVILKYERLLYVNVYSREPVSLAQNHARKA